MAELGKAYIQIIPSAKGISGSISSVLDKESVSAGKSSGANIVGGIKGAVAKGIAALGIGAMIGKSMSEGGKLQQSYLGGLDTLYGNAADKAREYADAAAKAGISQNEYAEQAVSFGAALKAAYGGNTTKAINAANTAIMDMTDNAAKMGTPIESIQDAYQGFAKQNYTMLDNLKLGYGGTKTEMERLLSDAEKISGQKYDISNLGDVYDAIHVIQGELGLTGVAAEEAKTTFQGSFNAMKASAANLLGDLAIGKDITPAIKSLVETTTTFIGGNLVPMAVTIAKGIPTAVGVLIDTLKTTFQEKLTMDNISSKMDEIGKTIQEKAPVIFDKLMTIAIPLIIRFIQKVGDTLIQSIPTLAQKAATGAMDILQSVITSIQTNGPAILEQIVTMLQGWWQQLPSKLVGMADGLSGILDSVLQNEDGFLSALDGFIQKIPEHVVTFLTETIPEIIRQLSSKTEENGNAAILPAIGRVLVKIGQIILKAIPKIIVTLIKLVLGLIGALLVSVGKLVISAVSALGKKIVTTIVGAVSGLAGAIGGALGTVKDTVAGAFKAIPGVVNGIWNRVKSGAKGAWNSIKSIISDKIASMKQAVTNGIDRIKSTFDKLKTIPSKIRAVFTQAKDAAVKKINDLKGKISGVVDKIKGFFPIKLSGIFSNFKTPHINVTYQTIKALGKEWRIPKDVSVKMYRKAMQVPYMFKQGATTFFGAGDAKDEMLYSHARLMQDISNASGRGVTQEVNVTLNAYEREDAEAFAERASKILIRKMRMA